jgi:phosphate transport system protein
MVMQTFELELRRLQDELLALGGMVGTAIVDSVEVLKRRDIAGARQIVTLGQRISKKRFAIEMDCLTLIVTKNPQDEDLRVITSILEIATELERIGGYATDIARIPFLVTDGSLLNLLVSIQSMAAKAQSMLRRTLKAFVERDLALAQAIPAEDDEVDEMYSQVYQQLLVFMRSNSRVKGDSRALVNQARYLGRVVRNIERIADQVAHLCEWVVFTTTGSMAVGETVPAFLGYSPGPQEVPVEN